MIFPNLHPGIVVGRWASANEVALRVHTRDIVYYSMGGGTALKVTGAAVGEAGGHYNSRRR